MTQLQDHLLEGLQRFDGKAVSILSELAAEFRPHPDYLMTLAALSGHTEGSVSDGATWLIKAHLDEGGALNPETTAELTRILPQVTSWAAQLHLCQCSSRLPLTAIHHDIWADWLQPLLRHKRPFLRAWSLDALVHIARQNPSFVTQAKAALKTAQKDPAASVKARARKLDL